MPIRLILCRPDLQLRTAFNWRTFSIPILVFILTTPGWLGNTIPEAIVPITFITMIVTAVAATGGAPGSNSLPEIGIWHVVRIVPQTRRSDVLTEDPTLSHITFVV